MRHFVWVLALAGCGVFGGRFSDEREVCDAYLDCAGEVEPDTIGERIADYGEKSACWDDADQAALCATACQTGASILAGRAEVQKDRCELAAAGPGGTGPLSCEATMNEDRFIDDFNAIMCDESQSCGDGDMADMWCDPPETGTNPYGCTLDPAKACECLAGAFTCNEEFTGFEYVEPPVVCAEIYDCSGDDR